MLYQKIRQFLWLALWGSCISCMHVPTKRPQIRAAPSPRQPSSEQAESNQTKRFAIGLYLSRSAKESANLVKPKANANSSDSQSPEVPPFTNRETHSEPQPSSQTQSPEGLGSMPAKASTPKSKDSLRNSPQKPLQAAEKYDVDLIPLDDGGWSLEIFDDHQNLVRQIKVPLGLENLLGPSPEFYIRFDNYQFYIVLDDLEVPFYITSEFLASFPKNFTSDIAKSYFLRETHQLYTAYISDPESDPKIAQALLFEALKLQEFLLMMQQQNPQFIDKSQQAQLESTMAGIQRAAFAGIQRDLVSAESQINGSRGFLPDSYQRSNPLGRIHEVSEQLLLPEYQETLRELAFFKQLDQSWKKATLKLQSGTDDTAFKKADQLWRTEVGGLLKNYAELFSEPGLPEQRKDPNFDRIDVGDDDLNTLARPGDLEKALLGRFAQLRPKP